MRTQVKSLSLRFFYQPKKTCFSKETKKQLHKIKCRKKIKLTYVPDKTQLSCLLVIKTIEMISTSLLQLLSLSYRKRKKKPKCILSTREENRRKSTNRITELGIMTEHLLIYLYHLRWILQQMKIVIVRTIQLVRITTNQMRPDKSINLNWGTDRKK